MKTNKSGKLKYKRRRTKVIDLVFEDVEKFLFKLMNQAIKVHNLNPEEALEAVHLGFMQAHETHTDSKSSWMNWIAWKVNKRLLDLVRKRGIESGRKVRSLTSEMMDEMYAREERRFLEDWKEELSDDAKLVVDLVFDSPMNVKATLAQIGDDEPASWRYAIRDYLRDLEWTKTRMNNTFREIRSKL